MILSIIPDAAISLVVEEILIFIIIVGIVIVERGWHLAVLLSLCLYVLLVVWILIIGKPFSVYLFFIHFPHLLLKLLVLVVWHELVLIHQLMLVILHQIWVEKWSVLIIQITQILAPYMWRRYLIELVVDAKATQLIMKHSGIVAVVEVHGGDNLRIRKAEVLLILSLHSIVLAVWLQIVSLLLESWPVVLRCSASSHCLMRL